MISVKSSAGSSSFSFRLLSGIAEALEGLGCRTASGDDEFVGPQVQFLDTIRQSVDTHAVLLGYVLQFLEALDIDAGPPCLIAYGCDSARCISAMTATVEAETMPVMRPAAPPATSFLIRPNEAIRSVAVVFPRVPALWRGQLLIPSDRRKS